MTGLGGGILLLPLLIVVLRVPAMIAIGSGTAFAAITKTGAAVTYWNRRQVDWGLVGYLACGSVPAGLLGIALLGYLRSNYGDSINKILSVVIGVLLLVIASLMMWRSPIERDGQTPMRSRLPEWITPRWARSSLELWAGFLVGATSMGAGSVIMILLLLFYNRSPRVLVGTDIFHGVILTTATTMGHLRSAHGRSFARCCPAARFASRGLLRLETKCRGSVGPIAANSADCFDRFGLGDG